MAGKKPFKTPRDTIGRILDLGDRVYNKRWNTFGVITKFGTTGSEAYVKFTWIGDSYKESLLGSIDRIRCYSLLKLDGIQDPKFFPKKSTK